MTLDQTHVCQDKDWQGRLSVVKFQFFFFSMGKKYEISLFFPFHRSINFYLVVFPHFFGQELWGAIQISIIDGRWNAESVRELFLFPKFLIRTPIHRGGAHGKIFVRVKMWKHIFVKMWTLIFVKMWKQVFKSTHSSMTGTILYNS